MPWPDLFFHIAETSALKAVANPVVKPLFSRLMKAADKFDWGGGTHKYRVKPMSNTQNNLILNHIDKNGSISQREAIMDYSIQSLTKRISELRAEGWPIIREDHAHPVTGQRYARYRFDDESVAK